MLLFRPPSPPQVWAIVYTQDLSPPSPPTLGGTRFQSPPELGDLGGKNLRDETQETYVYTVDLNQKTSALCPLPSAFKGEAR